MSTDIPDGEVYVTMIVSEYFLALVCLKGVNTGQTDSSVDMLLWIKINEFGIKYK